MALANRIQARHHPESSKDYETDAFLQNLIPWNAITWRREVPPIVKNLGTNYSVVMMIVDKAIDDQLNKSQERHLGDLFDRFTPVALKNIKTKGYQLGCEDLNVTQEEFLTHVRTFSRAANVKEEQYKALELP